ncbi:MAG: 2-oxo acid dehydrogenase subunit E2 [Actinomycetota bacterium]|nr:2-oxo acid dehydrogenase subunit E2 [Actinomycetota bacterium]
MAEVIMPKMGDAMEEGTLLKWLKSEGDEVEEGEPIAEIETDKASMEIEAEDSGTLHEIIAQEGQDVPVGEAIAVILGEGEEPPDRDGEVEAEEEAEAEESTEAQAQTATETEEEEAPETEEEPAATTQPEGGVDGQVRASPIVRRLAHENNLDLSQIEGSGPQGRIVERDVRAAIESGVAQADGKAETEAPEAPTEEQPQEAPQAIWQPPQLPEPTGAPGTEVQEPTRMQQIIGERMTAAWQQAPHFYATVEVQMDEAMALRAQLNEKLAEEEIKLSINDLVMKACASALKDFPKLNSLYTSEGIELHEKVDMAMAVALEDGLITPVIRDCANKGLSAISRESKDLAKRAHEGDLTPEEYQGGSITVSNMGMFGVESFSAIINPPQAAIVAVSSIIKRPTYNEDGEVVPANLMKLTLSADHRIANGADGAHYMATVKRLLESPMLLLV